MQTKLAPHQPTGFTLIELLIVVSLSVIIMLAASALFMTLLIGNTKTSSAKLIKDEGDYAMGQMEFLIRNATNLVQVDDVWNISNACQTAAAPSVLRTCDAVMCGLALQSRDGGITVLGKVDDNGDAKIGSNSAFLTSDNLELTAGPTFTCSDDGSGVGRYIGISFTLRKGTPGIDQPRDIVEQTFTAGAQIRSY